MILDDERRKVVSASRSRELMNVKLRTSAYWNVGVGVGVGVVADTNEWM